MNAPAFGQHAQFFDRVKDLPVEELIPQFRVEALATQLVKKDRRLRGPPSLSLKTRTATVSAISPGSIA
jgi:hypothetical protein